MPLDSIEILGFRGFSERQTVRFAKPNGMRGSGLTLITGGNNTGKSSILECLRARSSRQTPSFHVGARNVLTDSVEIKYSIDGHIECLRSIRKGTSETTKENEDRNLQVFVVPSRRSFNPYFSRNQLSREQYLQSYPLPTQRSSALSGFESRLFLVQRQPELFNQLLGRILPFKPEWSIDQSEQGQYFLKFVNQGHHHSSDGLGDGIVGLFAIIDAIYDSKPGHVIAIDEPELSLHPSLQKRLCSLVLEIAQDRQVVLSTHSPYFVDPAALINGAELIRVYSDAAGTRVRRLSESSKGNIKRIGMTNLNNPHIFGLEAREIFFHEDSIILTEGQDDVVHYPSVVRQLGQEMHGDFYGWGVGGAANMDVLCEMLNELGYKRVAGLLDKNQDQKANDLRRRFPGYFFACIPAADIRTKASVPTKASVLGLLDENLEVRPEFSEAMRSVLSKLDAYLTDPWTEKGEPGK